MEAYLLPFQDKFALTICCVYREMTSSRLADEPFTSQSTRGRAMDARDADDSVTRELRRFELARRLIFHQARTQTISAFTGLSRDRLATLRRRLMVPENERRRGPAPTSLDALLRTSRGRTEGAALVALFSLFNNPPGRKRPTALDTGEHLCEIFDAYLAYCPHSQVQFEELALLKKSLAKRDLIEVGLCRRCNGLIMHNRSDIRIRRTCWHCAEGRDHDGATAVQKSEGLD